MFCQKKHPIDYEDSKLIQKAPVDAQETIKQQTGVTVSNWDVEIGSLSEEALNQSWNKPVVQHFMRVIAEEYNSDNFGYNVITQINSMFTQLSSISFKCKWIWIPESTLLLDNKSTVN